jgi:hypothetical protein
MGSTLLLILWGSFDPMKVIAIGVKVASNDASNTTPIGPLVGLPPTLCDSGRMRQREEVAYKFKALTGR